MKTSLSLRDILPSSKRCPKCHIIVFSCMPSDQTKVFNCSTCSLQIKLFEGTLLQNSKLSLNQVDLLIKSFIKGKNVSNAYDLLYSHKEERLNAKTVEKYFDLFNRITLKYYLNKLETCLLEGIVEIDETHLYKQKKSSAPHRPYVLGDIWLFGMKDRITKSFLIVPLLSREEKILIPLIRRFIRIGSTIYSDSFASYVNSKSCPKQSKLAQYNYPHEFVIHKIEFVSPYFPEVHTNSIESLWKDFKRFNRNINNKTKYLCSVSRFHFHHDLDSSNQLKYLMEGLFTPQLPEYQEFEEKIFNNLYFY